MSKIKYREIFSCSIGSGLEYYDFIVFGFFATSFAPLFFPSESIFLSTLWGYTAFAVGFIFRPIGGVIFGHIGDRLGRKIALSSSIILMGLATLLIGILPTYNSIGMIAPLLLVFARIIQGISAGGEFPGGAVFVLEHSNKNSKGFSLSIVVTGTMFGTLLASIVSYLSTAFNMSWRVPFILGFLISIIGLYIRNKVEETAPFINMKNSNSITKYPIINGIKKFPMRIMWIAIATWFSFCAFVIQVIYLPSYIKSTSVPISHETIDLSVILVVIISIIVSPIAGYISDKVKKEIMITLVIMLQSILLLVTYRYLYELNTQFFLLSQLMYAILNGALSAPLMYFLVESITDTSVKYSSYALANSIGAILSGCCPLIATTLINIKNGNYLLGNFVMILGVLAIFSIHKINCLIKRKELTELKVLSTH